MKQAHLADRRDAIVRTPTMQKVTRPPSEPFWGDETPTVQAVLAWAAQRVVHSGDPKTTARSASALAAATGPTITADGIGGAEALRIFDEVLAPATRSQDDPMNLAYIPSAPTRSAVAFDFATSAANIFGGIWETGAGAIYAENEALAWLVELLGWPADAGGCFVSGGTAGTLSALVTARETIASRRGGRPPQGWALACTEGAHSSVFAASRVLDVAAVTVPADERGHLTGPALDACLAEHPEVFAVVATAGTTNAGVVDDIADIADVCARHGVWLHVDGAYGGAALAAASVRHRFDGIERADSFIVDPHKWLYAPYDCCALLYRDPRTARVAHAQHASYLDAIDRDQWNPSDLALHLSRRVRGLPFWFSLATHGTAKYSEAVELSLRVAREIADGVAAADHLRLVLAPELSVLLFERPGWSPQQYAEWSHRLAVAGVILCVPTTWEGRQVLRLVVVNPETRSEQVLAALETLRDEHRD
jgi:glutamate/tyrosine decarboxylase-like PLP-dependent enzyme